MKEQPDWSRYSDRQLQEAIASNVFLTVASLRSIYYGLIMLNTGIFGLAVRHFGWREFLSASWQ